MKIERFSDQTVWQEGPKLVRLPPDRQVSVTRSVASVGANIAEGFGRRTTRELLRSLQVARGELEETRYFLILSHDLRHLEAAGVGNAIAGVRFRSEAYQWSRAIAKESPLSGRNLLAVEYKITNH